MKFREGDEVVLVNHMGDSFDGLELGAIGIVEYDDGYRSRLEGVNSVKVLWKTGIRVSPCWWVHGSNIELYNVCLENK